MSIERTQAMFDRYFDLMGRAADFAECYAPDVTWLIADTGEVIHGQAQVRDFIVALHARMVDAQTRSFLVGENYAFLEGDCASADPDLASRTFYCVVYDVTGELIAAMRCYGIGTRLGA